MRTYRNAFVFAVVSNIALVGILGGLWWRYRQHKETEAPMPSASSGGAQNVPNGPESASMAPHEASLVPIQLSPERMQSIGVRMGRVERKMVGDEIRATGNVAVDETKLAYVQVRYSGYIQKVFADATYQYLRKGQPLFTIYSPDLTATEREYLVAKQNQQRVAGSTVPGVAESAASLLDAAAERLKQWGVPPREIARLESTGQVQQELQVDSPVSGYITERNALPNLTVQPETRLYSVADLSTVWIFAEVFQNDLGRIKVGDRATLTVDTYPGRNFEGRVNFIYPQVDMTTRTARVRLIFPNPGLKLTPGMFVNTVLQVRAGTQLVIPASGVLQSGTRQVVFVNHGDGYLEPRDVELGARAGEDFVVLKGLKEGEEIVTSANFLIDSESQLQAALGSFTPPPPGAGTAGAMNAPPASVELTTEPSPPRKSGNVIRVKLSEASGAPISGAEVSVTFFMPAMPAMGMAAMRTPVTLSDKGNGLYEASAQLDSGGTWQVTVIAKKNGQTVASKQLSVNATGGM
jgi:Cu(I)/Ag(I) efflux system membrane fusion protein/cobalt-zinc-cadmium efflux system membrane fusion protein